MSRELHIVGFRVGRETYGVPITSLHEIVRVPEITAVPDAPDYHGRRDQSARQDRLGDGSAQALRSNEVAGSTGATAFWWSNIRAGWRA